MSNPELKIKIKVDTEEAIKQLNKVVGSMKCKTCKYFKPDSEYDGLGECISESCNDSIVVLGTDDLLVSDDFGCIFHEIDIIQGSMTPI